MRFYTTRLYTLVLISGKSDFRYLEQIEALDDEGAIVIAREAVDAIDRILDWTVATLSGDGDKVVWTTTRAA